VIFTKGLIIPGATAPGLQTVYINIAIGSIHLAAIKVHLKNTLDPLGDRLAVFVL
jgi:hypothetical protein